MSGDGVGPETIFTALSKQIASLGQDISDLRSDISEVKSTKEIVERVEEDVSAIKKSLHGNGKEGLLSRVYVLETAQEDESDDVSDDVSLALIKRDNIKAWLSVIDKWATKIFQIVILIVAAKYGYNEFVAGEEKVGFKNTTSQGQNPQE